MKDPYEVLGIGRNAEPEVIAAAYRALMRKHHPDISGAADRAREINEAYRTLSDTDLKGRYDTGATVDQERRRSDLTIGGEAEGRGHRSRATRRKLVVLGALTLLLVAMAVVAALNAEAPQSRPEPATETVALPETASAPAAMLPAKPLAALSEFPEAFRGSWNMNVADCGTGMNDSALTISDRMIGFYESRGGIHVLQQTSDREISGYVLLTGEGEGPWLSAVEFRLSPDGATLTDGEGLVRHRCPTMSAASG